jgi:hypothetical protein
MGFYAQVLIGEMGVDLYRKWKVINEKEIEKKLPRVVPEAVLMNLISFFFNVYLILDIKLHCETIQIPDIFLQFVQSVFQDVPKPLSWLQHLPLQDFHTCPHVCFRIRPILT